MKVEIFDVEMGNCALITADTGSTMLIDCGHNNSTGWRPSNHLPGIGLNTIDLLIVSNYDNDHVSDLANLRQNLTIRSLLRNKSVSSRDLLELKSEKGVGNGIRELTAMIDTYTGGPLTVDWGDLTLSTYMNKYPDDFKDENNLSVVTFLQYQGLHMVLPGDLERPGWLKLLERQDFSKQLSAVNIFVASHHGRENGTCEEIFCDHGCKPDIFIISDAGIQYQTQETNRWYANRANGVNFDGNTRNVLTTRNDGKITVQATSQGTMIYTG